MRPAAEAPGIPLDVAAACPRPAGRRATAGRCVSALSNLLDNAVKYSESGRAGRDRRAPRRTAWSIVAVRGPRASGSRRRDLERIFERFYRVDRARSRADRRHRARSRHRAPRRPDARRRGHGRVPRRRGIHVHGCGCRRGHGGASPSGDLSEAALMADRPARSSSSTTSSRTATRSSVGARSARASLVETAADGAEAIERFDASSPALILLDVMLPQDVGRRRVPRDPHPLAGCRSSWSRRATREIDAVVGLEVGADDYVTKPFRLRELIARGAGRAASGPRRRRDEQRARRHARGRRRAARRRAPRGRRCAASWSRCRSRSSSSSSCCSPNAGSGAHARRADRPHLGPELLRRHQDARRAHQAAAGQGRGVIPANPTRIVTVRGVGLPLRADLTPAAPRRPARGRPVSA